MLVFYVNNLETFLKNNSFVPPNFDENNKKLLDLIPILIKKMEAACFEGAAISAAIEMETRSIEVSTPQSKEETAVNIKSYSNE
jgi:hypothetical protein